MNYDEARQIEPTIDRPDAGKWRYTRLRDGVVWAIGYCSSIGECPAQCWQLLTEGEREGCQTCKGQGYVELEHPCPGHDTREGAERHYYEWEADHLREVGFRTRRGLARLTCEVGVAGKEQQCEELTNTGLTVNGGYIEAIPLCDRHRNRDGWLLARPFVPGVTSIHS